MAPDSFTSLQRVLTTLGHREADRVPLFLLVTLHGAHELGVGIQEYFSKPEYVAEGQLRLRARFGHDCLYAFHYAPIEIEAWGGEVVYCDDGPPNSGEPFLSHPDLIARLESPPVLDTPCLRRVLTSIELLKDRSGDDVPIIGVVMSPFSLPVMQLGFAAYLDLMVERPDLLERLMRVNEEFCVAWANAQLTAGATAICYFDPVSSSTIIPRGEYLRVGLGVAKRTLSRIKGPTATHFASGRCQPIIDDVATTGTLVVGVSADEDLGQLKEACRGRLSLLGNLNGIEMRRWTHAQAEQAVKDAIACAGAGGGFILSDNHGEVPLQVPEDVLMAVADAVKSWGRYPLHWTERDERRNKS